MPTELCSKKPRPIDVVHNGEPLFARKMPFRLGFKIQGGLEGDSVQVDADLVAEIIVECVVTGKGKPAFKSTAAVLSMDAGAVSALFAEVSAISFSIEDAEKN